MPRLSPRCAHSTGRGICTSSRSGGPSRRPDLVVASVLRFPPPLPFFYFPSPAAELFLPPFYFLSSSSSSILSSSHLSSFHPIHPQVSLPPPIWLCILHIISLSLHHEALTDLLPRRTDTSTQWLPRYANDLPGVVPAIYQPDDLVYSHQCHLGRYQRLRSYRTYRKLLFPRYCFRVVRD